MIETMTYNRVEVKGDGLRVHLKASLLRPGLWEQVYPWFSGAEQSPWLEAPFRVMTAEGAGPSAARWKQITVEGLSWLIFLLLVPGQHPLVKLGQVIDWGTINRLCQECNQNSQRGQRAWAPAQLFSRLVLLLVWPVNSETGLLQLVAIVPLYRWFCGFGMFSARPDHRTLSTFRHRWGPERFEGSLIWLVQQGDQQGWLAKELAFFDLMGVKASARAWSPYERAVLLTYGLIRYLSLAEPGQAPPGEVSLAVQQLAAEVALEVLDNKRLKAEPKRVQRGFKSLAQGSQGSQGQALWHLSLEETVQSLLADLGQPSLEPEAAPQRAWLKTRAQHLKARLPHARGDLEAGLRWVSSTTVKCGYWLGFLVDSLHQLITGVRVVSLNVDQRPQLLPALDQPQPALGQYPPAVVTDSAQDYDPVHQALADHQLEAHIASRSHKGSGGGFDSA